MANARPVRNVDGRVPAENSQRSRLRPLRNVNRHLTVKMSHRAFMTAEKCERAWDARSDLAGGGHYSAWPNTAKRPLKITLSQFGPRKWTYFYLAIENATIGGNDYQFSDSPIYY